MIPQGYPFCTKTCFLVTALFSQENYNIDNRFNDTESPALLATNKEPVLEINL